MRVIFALLLALLGAAAFHHGLSQREGAEPAGLLTGPGLLVGTEGDADVEVRGQLLSQPSLSLRDAGQGRRSLGVGLLALALAVVALRPPRSSPRSPSPRGARWARVVWLVPGALAFVKLVRDAGAGAPTAALAREAYVESVALFGLSFVLLATWRA